MMTSLSSKIEILLKNSFSVQKTILHFGKIPFICMISFMGTAYTPLTVTVYPPPPPLKSYVFERIASLWRLISCIQYACLIQASGWAEHGAAQSLQMVFVCVVGGGWWGRSHGHSHSGHWEDANKPGLLFRCLGYCGQTQKAEPLYAAH